MFFSLVGLVVFLVGMGRWVVLCFSWVVSLLWCECRLWVWVESLVMCFLVLCLVCKVLLCWCSRVFYLVLGVLFFSLFNCCWKVVVCCLVCVSFLLSF